tara:strand:+ start:2768 stop:4528 length:1761 start_codon:yes stop_codon:yes gene_type:complete
MIIELSKDKSIKGLLLKSDIDKETMSLVKEDADLSTIRNSLIKNMNSNNLVEYRRFIAKAEEETLEEKERKKITDAQFKQILSLMAKVNNEEESQVDRTKIPLLRNKAKQMIKDLKAELKTKEDIGVDEDDSIDSATEYDADLRGTSSRQKKLDAAKEAEKIKESADKKEAKRTLKKVSGWLPELEAVVAKLNITNTNGELKVKRMTEYQVFGNSENESNTVITWVQILTNDENYLSNKYAKFLVPFDFGGGKKYTKVLIDYKLIGEQRLPDSKNAIIVDDIESRYKTILSQSYDGFTLLEILEAMHSQRHGKVPTSRYKAAPRKKELNRLAQFIQGNSPKDEASYKRVVKKVKSIRNDMAKSFAQKNQIEEKLSKLKELKDDTDGLVARKLRRLNAALRTIVSVKDMQGAVDTIKEITDNPKPYIDELVEEITKDIEIEEEKLKVVSLAYERAMLMRPLLTRINKAMMQIDILREDTGQEPSGALKKIFGKLYLPLTRAKTTLDKLDIKTKDLGVTIENAITEWQLKNMDKNITIDSGGMSYEGISDIEYAAINSISELGDKLETYSTSIDSIMNEYETMVGGEE